MLSKGPMILNFWRASQRSKDLNFGRASQRSDGFEVWTYYVEVWSICGRWYLCQCIWVLYPSSCYCDHWRIRKEIAICHLFWRSFIWSYAQEIYPSKLWLWRFFHWSFSKFLMTICSLEIFPMKIYSLEIYPWKIETFFFLKRYLEDLSFKHLKLKKKKRFIHRDFSLKIHSRDFSIAILKNFNEDLFIGDFSFDDLKIFNEDLFIEDFSFWRFVHGVFSLKIYSGDFSIRFLKIF